MPVCTIQCNILKVSFQSNKVQDKEGEPHKVLQIRGVVCINTKTPNTKPRITSIT
jgi:hypothetical protein